MSDSVQPHRQQPTRLPRPWDSPGKNTGVGCHVLLQCMQVKSKSRSVVSDSSQPHGLQPTRLLHPWDFPGESTGMGCHCLLQVLCYWYGKNGRFHYTSRPSKKSGFISVNVASLKIFFPPKYLWGISTHHLLGPRILKLGSPSLLRHFPSWALQDLLKS